VELIEEAMAAFRRGDTEHATRITDIALEVARKGQDARREVDALCMHARIALRLGELDRVVELAGEARAKAAGDPRLERTPIHVQAVAARMRGDLASARDLYRASLDLSESLGEGSMAAAEHHNLAYVELHAGNHERARRLFLEARRRAERLGLHGLYPYLLADAAQLAVEDGDAAKAATLLGAADAAFGAAGEIPDPDDAAEHQRLRAQLLDVLGESAFRFSFDVGSKLTVEQAFRLL